MLERDALPRILPFAAYIAFFFVSDILVYWGVGAAPLRYVYPLKIALVAGLLWWFRRRYVELAWQPLPLRHGLLALTAGVVVLVLWLHLDARWMQLGASAGFDPRNDGTPDWALVVVRIAGAALVVPVMEELFWRSYLMRWIQSAAFLQAQPARVGWRALLVSSALFGIEHNLWLAGIVAGLVYGFLYIHTRNLWTAIVAHAVTNGLLGVWIISTGNWTYW